MAALRFVRDPVKTGANLGRHGVSFDEAQRFFADERARSIGDPDHSDDEDRFILLGLSSSLRVLLVVHCHRSQIQNRSGAAIRV